MRFGVRRRNYKSSFKAMTTAKAKRSLWRALLPGYGKKGTGMFKNPSKSMYNKVYRKTTSKLPGLYPSSHKKRT